MNPWSTDADVIKIDSKENLNRYIIYNGKVKEYLENTGENDNKYFIVAPKGYGKTLLLKAKSNQYREKSGYSFIPENALLEKLSKSTIHFSTEELNRYKTLDIWEDIWLLSLLILIIKNVAKSETIPEIDKLVGRAKALPDILYNVLDDRKNLYHKYKPLIHKQLLPIVRDINFQVAVFIDNVDEAFDQHIGENYKRNQEEKSNAGLSPQVWVHAQLGMISAVKAICIQNKHIKIFCSLRREAFVLDNSPCALIQNTNYTTELNYNKNELKEIFNRNINLTKTEKLVKLDGKTPVEKFIGFSKIPHNDAIDSSGKPQNEEVFEYIWRHSFARPREIVEIGKKIHELKPEERTVEKIRDVVNKTSNILLQQYKNEMIPYFKDNVYDELCKLLDQKIIKKEKAKEISRYIEDKFQFKNVFQSLYRLGIVGWIDRDKFDNTKFVQKFLEIATYNFQKKKEIPEYSNYFIMHPSAHSDLYKYNGVNSQDPNNIIGHGKEFHENPDNSKINHLHVGMGRISQCLIIPLIKENANIGVIQNPGDKEWGDLPIHKELEIRVNNISKINFKIYHDKLTEYERKSLINRWLSKNENVFFYTDDEALILKLFNRTEGISIIKRSSYSWILPLVYKINNSHKFNVYTINLQKPNHKDIQLSLLKKGYSNIKVIPVIADRYFHKKRTSREGKKLIIHNTSEDYGEVVVYSKNKKATELFYPNKFIEIAKSSKDFRFYLKKHKLFSESIFKLHKLLLHFKDQICDNDGVFELFSQIQVYVLKDYLEDAIIKNQVFPNLIDSEINQKINAYSGEHRQRVIDLPEDFKTIDNLKDYQKKIKGEKILPSENDLFDILNTIKNKGQLNSECLFCLLNVFNYKASKRISSLMIDTDNMSNKKIFISYSHKDSMIVDEIDDYFKDSFGIDIIRDEKDLEYNERLEDFMNKIRDVDFAFILVTDHYLKSKYCLYELLQLKKERDYLSKILPIITKEKEILGKDAKDYYNNYWREQLSLAEKDVKNDPSQIDISNLRLMKYINNYLNEFIDHCMSTRLLTFESLKADNYLPILKILSDHQQKVILQQSI